MSLLSNLKIAHRVLLLAAVALAGILALSAIFIVQRQVEADYRAGADRLTERQSDIAGMMADFRDTLLWEQQFLLGRDIQSSANFTVALEKAKATAESLRAGAADAVMADLDALAAGFDTYAAGFATLVKRNQELGLKSSEGLEGAMREAVHSIEKRLEAVDDANLRASMLMMRRHEKDFILRRDASYIEKHTAEAVSFAVLMKKVFKPGAERMRVADALDVYVSAFRLYAETSLKEAESRKIVSAAYSAVEPVVARVMAAYEAEKTALIAANQRVAERNMAIVAGLIAVTVLILLAGVSLIGRSIARPLVAITSAMRSLAGGQTELAAPGLGRRDEFGAMAAALETFRQAALANARLEQEAETARHHAEAERLRIQEEAEAAARERLLQATGGLAVGLQRLASGDLSFALTQSFAPDFEALREDLNSTLYRLSDVMGEIAQSSDAIASGSSEISGSTSDLARRTEQQAASLEETAAALDQITANVKSASMRAAEARTVAETANASAIRTGQLVSEAVQAMERIEQSSGRISSIIGVIDEIAFQTNLLALNAGVEAARAGEAGRGFAVVAHEVRELAQRSASAAREIKELIRNSAAEVSDGVRYVRDTGIALTEIGGSVDVMNRHIEAIALSAREQAVGLAEVNVAVNQMDQGTQQNAAMVEENNAASAVLATEAARLRNLVSIFKLNDAEGARDVAPLRMIAGGRG